jgi:hypothetical protein
MSQNLPISKPADRRLDYARSNRGRMILTSVASLIAATSAFANALLFDFGADATQTVGGSTGESVQWNNLTATVGADDFGLLSGLLLTDGTPTDIAIQMVSRFNGANENGVTTHPSYPGSATRDSLFGNTEAFSGLENITPVFKLTTLNAAATYTLKFYGSRSGVADNRETRYTVTGAAESFADLNIANNVTNTVTVSNVAPNVDGEISIALTPGPNNNNGNHFTYLGVLEISISTGGRILVDFGAAGSPTELIEAPPSASWNNITATMGIDPAGQLAGLVSTNGTATAMGFQMVSRFNGANTGGAQNSTILPVTATQDSLFGNTEAFNNLSNILPVFKLTGLDTNYVYSFNFYASRTGASDNRETRYTVTGANSGTADLNASNNIDTTANVTGIRANDDGEITIALTAGPNNNNANHFTYIGAMRMDFEPIRTPRLLIDFGASGTPTVFGAGDPDNYWNNLIADVGGTDTGTVANLVKTDGTATGIALNMVSRFNGANENGVNPPAVFVGSATRDSLYGNTEAFNGLENITPVFKLTGLNPEVSYDFSFFASRTGVGDNRETRYTVTGATETFADLNVANNETEIAVVSDIKPTAEGEITIALTPGPNNDNGNHFTYLGVLQVDWTAPAVVAPAVLSAPAYAGGSFSFTLTGSAGGTYVVQRTRNFSSWETAQTVTLTGASQQVQITQGESEYFYRAVAQ